MKENIVRKKSYSFALRIIKLHKFLTKQKRKFVLSKQILRSGTSIGANIEESCYAQSKKDFISKLSISLKEAAETMYWLKLLRDSQEIEEKHINNYIAECDEIIRLLSSIIRTCKEKSNS